MSLVLNLFASLVGQKVESACNVGDPSLTPGQEDPLEKEMATHSSILAWKIPGPRSLTGYSPWVANSWTPLSNFTFLLS